jgi:hypothetical protein
MFPNHRIRSLTQLLQSLETNPDPHFIDELKADPAKAIRGVIDIHDGQQEKIGSIGQLKQILEEDPEMLDRIKQDPLKFIQTMVKEPTPPEYRIYHLLVGSLCALVLIIIIGVLLSWLLLNKREAPGLVTAMACVSLGILSGIFIRVPGRGERQKETGTR